MYESLLVQVLCDADYNAKNPKARECITWGKFLRRIQQSEKETTVVA